MRSPTRLRIGIAAAILAVGVAAAVVTLYPKGGSKANPILRDPLPAELFSQRELAPIAAREETARARALPLVARWLAAHPRRDDAAFTAYVQAQVAQPPTRAQLAAELPLLRRLDAGRTPARAQAVAWLFLHGKKDVWKLYEKQYAQLYGKARGKLAKGLLKDTIALANTINGGIKDSVREPHPLQLDHSLNPIVPHPSATKDAAIASDRTKYGYPSNHTNVSYAAATVLSSLEPARAGELFWMANEVSYSRLVAGVHFPQDLVAGAFEGTLIGSYEAHFAPRAGR